MTSYVGSNVTINCGDVIGHCQGIVKEVDQKSQTITISNPYRNGFKCPHNEMTIPSSDIVEITIIDGLLSTLETKDKKSPKIGLSSVKKEKRPKNNESRQVGITDRIPMHSSSPQPGSEYKGGKKYSKVRKGLYNRDDDTFDNNPQDMTEDFDFVKNLALFDKLAVYNEINSGSDGESMRTPSKQRHRKVEEKYKHDEFVLQKGPVIYRQIITNEVTKYEVSEYYTDAGLVVPTISNDTYIQILHAAELMGFGMDRQTEIFGANASLMALSVLGGCNRLHPRNSHQPPSAVVMCGPHRTGAQGVATARHLSNHNVKVNVFMPNFVKIHACLQEELRLLSLTDAVVISEYSELPTNPVDLIISAMDEEDCEFLYQQSWYQHSVRWCNENRAPLMCLSPPAALPPDLHIKWSVCAVLPFSLSAKYGALYMIDVGIPVRAFEKLGIQYQSPFCGKSFLHLHKSK
ncbi:enhancer of mRNA-decapping protein 3-like [Styela clava]